MLYINSVRKRNCLYVYFLLTQMPAVAEFTSNETMGHSTDRMCATFGISRREQVT